MTFTLLASERLIPSPLPTVQLAGTVHFGPRTVSATQLDTEGLKWTATYTIIAEDEERVSPLDVSNFADLALNPGIQLSASTDGTTLYIGKVDHWLCAGVVHLIGVRCRSHRSYHHFRRGVH